MWEIKILGVRGSQPILQNNYVNHGGNTPCVYLNCGEQLFLDAGTGIGTCEEIDGKNPVHILLSHMHLDHIQGLTSFPGLMQRGREVHIYGEKRDGKSLKEQLDTIFSPPYWPIRLEEFPAKVIFHDIQEGEPFAIGKCTVEPIRLNHPNRCTGYVISDGEKRMAYLLDCELEGLEEGAIAAVEGCDAAIMDGFFETENTIPGWGHSSWRQCAAFAQQHGIRTPIISHYSLSADDKVLEEQERLAGEDCLFAWERMVIEL